MHCCCRDEICLPLSKTDVSAEMSESARLFWLQEWSGVAHLVPAHRRLTACLLPLARPHAHVVMHSPRNTRPRIAQPMPLASAPCCPSRSAQAGGPAVARGHDSVVPGTLWGGVLGVDARQAHQVVRRERHALRAPRGLLGFHARTEKGTGRQGTRLQCCGVCVCVYVNRSLSRCTTAVVL